MNFCYWLHDQYEHEPTLRHNIDMRSDEFIVKSGHATTAIISLMAMNVNNPHIQKRVLCPRSHQNDAQHTITVRKTNNQRCYGTHSIVTNSIN